MVPFGIAAAYLLVFVLQLSYNLRALGWVSDYTSGFTVTETVVRTGTDGQTVLASSGQWVSLWFGLLTARLPMHRELWTIAPTMLFLATALTIGWSVAQFASRRAAIFTVLIILVASPPALSIFMAAVNHNTLYPCTALAGAYLVWLTRGRARSRVLVFGVPLLVGVAIGACLASDLLVGATALIPLLLVAVMAGLRRQSLARTVALSAFATSAAALVTAKLTSALMKSFGFVTLPTPFKVAKLSELGTQARLLFSGLRSIFNGDLGQAAPGIPNSELGVASEVVMLFAFLMLLAVGVRTAGKFLWLGWRKDESETKDQLARSLHIVYWVGSAVGACLAVWLTAEMSAANIHESYYVTVIFSVAAVVPIVASQRRAARWLVAIGASIFFAAGFVGLAGNDPFLGSPPQIAKYEAPIRAIAGRYHATTGYAGYWDASSTTWSTGNRVVIRPVMLCRNSAGADICPFYMERVPSWYVPRRRKTFLLVDTAEPWLNGLPPGLGSPVAAYAFGTMRMYIYSYDIDSRLGPALDPALF